MQLLITSKTIPLGHDLRFEGAKALPLGQSLCTKALPQDKMLENSDTI